MRELLDVLTKQINTWTKMLAMGSPQHAALAAAASKSVEDFVSKIQSDVIDQTAISAVVDLQKRLFVEAAKNAQDPRRQQPTDSTDSDDDSEDDMEGKQKSPPVSGIIGEYWTNFFTQFTGQQLRSVRYLLILVPICVLYFVPISVLLIHSFSSFTSFFFCIYIY